MARSADHVREELALRGAAPERRPGARVLLGCGQMESTRMGPLQK